MKKTVLIMVAVLLVFGTTSYGAEKSKEIVLKAVHYPPTGGWHATKHFFLMWVDRVNEASKGELQIRVLGGPEVIPVEDQVKATGEGVIDICLNYPTGHAALVPEAGTLQCSMITPWEEREVGYYDLIDKAHHKIGVKYLGRSATDSGFYIFSKKPITKLADFRGLKIRSHSGYKPFFDELGAVSIQMGLSDVYSALERGLVDAAPNIVFAYTYGWHEVAKYMLNEPFWDATNAMIFINLKKWSTLPAHLQDALVRETAKLERDIKPLMKQYVNEELKKFKEAGMEFTNLSPEESKTYRRLATEKAFYFGGLTALKTEDIERMKKMIWR